MDSASAVSLYVRINFLFAGGDRFSLSHNKKQNRYCLFKTKQQSTHSKHDINFCTLHSFSKIVLAVA